MQIMRLAEGQVLIFKVEQESPKREYIPKLLMLIKMVIIWRLLQLRRVELLAKK